MDLVEHVKICQAFGVGTVASGMKISGYAASTTGKSSLAIYGTALGTPTPPPGDGHGSLPRPLWEWVGWLWMGGNAG